MTEFIDNSVENINGAFKRLYVEDRIIFYYNTLKIESYLFKDEEIVEDFIDWLYDEQVSNDMN